jgi:cold-inducible RNA-binding protein
VVRLFFGNVAFKASEENLKAFVEEHGYEVEKVEIVTDRQSGRPKGYGFVNVAGEIDKAEAIERMNGQMLCGRVLTVNEAKPKNAFDKTSHEYARGGAR